jgi:hypothetical protein
MRTFKLNQRFILFGIFAAMLLVFTPSATMAGGGEPGGSCPGDWSYAAPPYMGVITVTLQEHNGKVFISGQVEQVGKSECSGNFFHELGVMGLEVFQSLRPNDLRMTCITNDCKIIDDAIICPFPCLEDGGFLEVVGVGNMRYITPRQFTARFIIMALE